MVRIPAIAAAYARIFCIAISTKRTDFCRKGLNHNFPRGYHNGHRHDPAPHHPSHESPQASIVAFLIT